MDQQCLYSVNLQRCDSAKKNQQHSEGEVTYAS